MQMRMFRVACLIAAEVGIQRPSGESGMSSPAAFASALPVSGSPGAEHGLLSWFGCECPIQLGAMGGGIGTSRLAYAVAAAGGLGMVGASNFDRAALVEAFGTGGARGPGQQVGAGFLMPFLDRGTVAAGWHRWSR